MQNKYLFRFAFLWWMNGYIAQNIQTINNCTCQLSNGSFYSLWPFRGIRKPYFIAVPGKKYPGWLYAYNPCTSLTFDQNDPHTKTLCHDIGICQYAKVEKPREYHQVGVQTGVKCGLTKEGQIELVYKTKDKTIDPTFSSVLLICDENAPFPSFEPKDEDNYIFTLTTKCACPDQCWHPVPEPTTTTRTTPEPETTAPTSVVPGPLTTSNSTKPSPRDSNLSNWKLWILLPSLAGGFFVIMCCCLWRHRYRCRHCCGEYQEPHSGSTFINPLETKETTKLIKNKPKVKAVEHEDYDGKGKLGESVQEEDMGDKNQILGKENVLSLVL